MQILIRSCERRGRWATTPITYFADVRPAARPLIRLPYLRGLDPQAGNLAADYATAVLDWRAAGRSIQDDETVRMPALAGVG